MVFRSYCFFVWVTSKKVMLSIGIQRFYYWLNCWPHSWELKSYSESLRSEHSFLTSVTELSWLFSYQHYNFEFCSKACFEDFVLLNLALSYKMKQKSNINRKLMYTQVNNINLQFWIDRLLVYTINLGGLLRLNNATVSQPSSLMEFSSSLSLFVDYVTGYLYLLVRCSIKCSPFCTTCNWPFLLLECVTGHFGSCEVTVNCFNHMHMPRHGHVFQIK